MRQFVQCGFLVAELCSYSLLPDTESWWLHLSGNICLSTLTLALFAEELADTWFLGGRSDEEDFS